MLSSTVHQANIASITMSFKSKSWNFHALSTLKVQIQLPLLATGPRSSLTHHVLLALRKCLNKLL